MKATIGTAARHTIAPLYRNRATCPHSIMLYHQYQHLSLLLLLLLPTPHQALKAPPSTSPRLPTWSSPRPNPKLPLGGYPVIKTKPELIFAATNNTQIEIRGTYNHNVFLHYLPSEDRLFAYWKNSPVDEDQPGQRILISWRDNDNDNDNEDADADADAGSNKSKWSTPSVLFGNISTPGRETVMFAAPAVTFPNGHTFAAASPGYYNRSKADVHVAQGSQCALWPDSIDERNCGPAESYAEMYHSTLLLRRIYANSTLGAMFWVQAPPLFAAATNKYHIPSTKDMDEETQMDVATLLLYHDDAYDVPCGEEFTGTTKCEWCAGGCQRFTNIDYSLGITNERSVFHTSDGVDVLFYRGRLGSPLLISTRSKQDGAWSPPVLSNIPNDASNMNAGRLSNGLRYLVHNPVTRSSTSDKHRDPLTLTTSWDGGWSWNDTGVLATCTSLPFGNCTPRYDHDVNIGPSYPQLLEVVSEGSRNVGVWVGFTNNKEDVWIVKIVGS